MISDKIRISFNLFLNFYIIKMKTRKDYGINGRNCNYLRGFTIKRN